MSNKIVFVVSDEGLGGVIPFGREIILQGYIAVLITGERPQSNINKWKSIYHELIILDDLYNSKKLSEVALKVAEGRQIMGLFSCYDGLVLHAAQASAMLGLPHPNINGLLKSRNKYAGRICTKKASLNTPDFMLVSNLSDVDNINSKLGWPVVMKPLNGMASHMVKKIEGPKGFIKHFNYMKANLLNSFHGNYNQMLPSSTIQNTEELNPESMFLVEQFLEGIEYSIEVLIWKKKLEVVTIFQKFIINQSNFFEAGFTQPGFELNEHKTDRINHFLNCAVRILELDNMVANIELIDTPEGPYLIEVNAGRPGGQLMVLAAKKSTGRDLIRDTVSIQLGQAPSDAEHPELNGRLTTFSVFPQSSGTLKSISGLEEVRKMKGVVDIHVFCNPGDKIDIKDKEIFIFNVLFVYEGTQKELENKYSEICEKVNFIYE